MGLAFLGDLMLGRNVLPVLERVGLRRLMARLDQLLSNRMLITNLECPLTVPAFSEEAKGFSQFHAPPDLAVQLRDAGFVAVSLGNNHLFDCGVKGMQDTQAALTHAGILSTGAGMNRTQAIRPMIVSLSGYRIGIIAFSFVPPAGADTPGVAYLYDESVEQAIRAANEEADFVIAMPHAGIELFEFPLMRDQRIYRKMIDLGVDLIIGSQAHCVQAMELYKGRHIFYSVGDCLFDHHIQSVWDDFHSPVSHAKRFSLPTDREMTAVSLAVLVDIDESDLAVTFEPVVTDTALTPRPLNAEQRDYWMEKFRVLCDRLQTDDAVQLQRAAIESQLLASLRFRGIV